MSSWQNFVTDKDNRDVYGFIYKMCSSKISTRNYTANIEIPNGFTRNWEETMEALLCELFGDGQESGEDTAPVVCDATDDAAERTEDEVKAAIRTMKNKKTSGIDCIEVEMLKPVADISFLAALTQLYNSCLRVGCFSEEWKEGNVRVLLKGTDKDLTKAKSYKPICLLSVVSKVLERLMKWKLGRQIRHPIHSSEKQFGYRRGLNTEEAIAEVRDIVRNTQESMVLALLFDITGAFDNLKWITILEQLNKRQCPRNLFLLVESYLTDRKDLS